MKKSLYLFILFLFAACVQPKTDYVRKYAAEPFAPSFNVSDIKNLDHLGSKVVDKGVSFNLYSERAERIDILLYDDPDSETPARSYTMSRYGNVWSIFIGGIAAGQYYAYRAWGPNWKYDAAWRPGKINGFQSDTDAYGNRFNPNKVLMDPYARAFHRDHDWTKGKAASGPFRLESTSAAAAKSIVIDDSKVSWSNAEATYWSRKKAGQTLKSEELVIYEVNLKGLTMNGASALYGVSHPGTYKGAGEFADYLKNLGVNVVEFLPVQEAAADGGYWKYWTIGFFAPEVEYAYDSERGAHVAEFRQMVEEFHKRGIEVWLDVVYNHTGEGGLWREHPPNFSGVFNLTDTSYVTNYDPYETATVLGFRGLDNNAYYQRPYNDTNAAAAGFYWEHTGTGNGMRTNNVPFRRLMLDSLRYWSEKMHIDGFRFDLAAQFGEMEGDYSIWSQSDTVIQDIVNDPLLQANNTRLVAEAWDAGGHYKVGEFPKASSGTWPASNGQTFSWYEWNGQFRDGIRSFLNEDAPVFNSKPWPYLVDTAGFVAGSGGIFDKQNCSYCVQRAPYSNVNFITVHDGFTLYDTMSYNQKYNCGGPLNPNCVDPNSGDNNNHSKDWVVESTKRQMVRNAAVFLFTANGTPILLGGDEWMRSQFGNNNPYHKDADNLYNWFRWGSWESEIVDGIFARAKNYDFFKRLIAFRKDNCWAFCHTTYAGIASDFEWWGAMGDGGPQYNSRRIGLRYKNPPADKKEIFIAFNFESADKGFSLPTGTWRVTFDTQVYYEGSDGSKLSANACLSGATPSCDNTFIGTNGALADYTVKSRSIVIFVRQS